VIAAAKRFVLHARRVGSWLQLRRNIGREVLLHPNEQVVRERLVDHGEHALGDLDRASLGDREPRSERVVELGCRADLSLGGHDAVLATKPLGVRIRERAAEQRHHAAQRAARELAIR